MSSIGFVVKSAVMGKVGDSDGDTLADPTSTFEYDLLAWQTNGTPNWAKTRVRETHQDVNTAWLEQRSYFSGAGGVVMVKAQARPGLAPQRDQDGELVLDQNGDPVLVDTSPDLRWVGNGRVVLDNKGNVVKAYEPYLSSTPEYEDEAELVEQGVTALNHYDPLGRLIRTNLPNGTFSRVEFSPWKQTSYDPNDTVLDSDWYTARINAGGVEQRAAELAEDHHGTPTVVHFDTLGRPFLSVAHNKDDQANSEYYETRSVLDIQGQVLKVIDARLNIAEERVYGMLGQSLQVISHDAGDRWRLLTALGEPMRTWDDRDQRFSYTYDTLRRPVDRSVSTGGGPEKLLGRVVYGDLLASPEATNHVGRVYRVYDGAGVATSTAFDFKGHPVTEQRQLVLSKTTRPDWSALQGQTTLVQMATAATPLLDSEVFEASTTHDAVGRVLTAISPDESEVAYTYDEGGRLQAVDLKHRGSLTAQTVVGDISYDARGQRQTVVHGPTNSPTTTTSYTYDPETYRLTRLHTVRGSDNAKLQDLYYHYDPVGNITDIRDEAQQTVYFQNAVVSAANSYTYDAVYRLIEATGREHSTQGTGQRTHVQHPIGPQPMTSDPSAMRRYTQEYTYDEVGNIVKMQHIPASGSGWTRHYVYDGDGNRLLETSAPGDPANGPYTHQYTYDAHGSMTTMPHIAALVWNSDDQLQQATVGTEEVYFQYACGQRSRKYVEKSGTTTEERIYLGPFELFRKRVNGTLDLERESLHVSDNSGRICIVETKTVDSGNAIQNPTAIWRYQHGNHLGSASTEVDASGAIISYEEYHPYGTSAYRAADGSIDVSAKRYRYTGMERDEETSLEYHSARYYAPWLGRWTATDPIGILDHENRYQYADAQPSLEVDLTGTSGRVVGEAVVQPGDSDADIFARGLLDGFYGLSEEEAEEYVGELQISREPNDPEGGGPKPDQRVEILLTTEQIQTLHEKYGASLRERQERIAPEIIEGRGESEVGVGEVGGNFLETIALVLTVVEILSDAKAAREIINGLGTLVRKKIQQKLGREGGEVASKKGSKAASGEVAEETATETTEKTAEEIAEDELAEKALSDPEGALSEALKRKPSKKELENFKRDSGLAEVQNSKRRANAQRRQENRAAEHRKNAREGTRNKHEKANARRAREQRRKKKR